MSEERFTEEQVALFAAAGISPEALSSQGSEGVETAISRLRDEREFANAVQDLQTIVLNTELIHQGEDSIRLAILRCAQFMPARALYAATYFKDEDFRTQAGGGIFENEPFYLILQYLRNTRAAKSATANSRDYFLGYPANPPKEQNELFQRIVDCFRDNQ